MMLVMLFFGFSPLQAQTFSNAIIQNNGVVMFADTDNSTVDEDFIWALDQPTWLNNSNTEKMRLSSTKLKLNTAFSMPGIAEFSIDSATIAGKRFVIKPNGNIGIGIADPQYRLHLNGSMRISGGLFRLDDAYSMASGTPFQIDSPNVYGGRFSVLVNGNIGIGKPVPEARLHVVGRGSTFNDVITNGRVWTGESSTKGGIWVNSVSHVPNQLFGTVDNTSKMGIWNKNQWNLVADSAGNIGIGTENPTKGRLHVVGSFHVENAEGKQTFHVSAGKQLVFVGDSAYIEYLASQSNTSSPIQSDTFSLWVSKGIVTEDLILANVAAWDDYVFDEKYELPAIEKLAAYIKMNKHLPNIPSEEEVKQKGYSTNRLNRGFLKTMEELTLYTIGQDRKIKELEARIDTQQAKLNAYDVLATQVEKLQLLMAEQLRGKQ